MRTPAGSECPHYFEDFHRGRNRQECRLIARNPGSRPWRPELCAVCPVPRFLQANACPKLVLRAQVRSGLLGLRRKVEVSAECRLSLAAVPEPEIGCGRCHEVFQVPAGPAGLR